MHKRNLEGGGGGREVYSISFFLASPLWFSKSTVVVVSCSCKWISIQFILISKYKSHKLSRGGRGSEAIKLSKFFSHKKIIIIFCPPAFDWWWDLCWIQSIFPQIYIQKVSHFDVDYWQYFSTTTKNKTLCDEVACLHVIVSIKGRSTLVLI